MSIHGSIHGSTHESAHGASPHGPGPGPGDDHGLIGEGRGHLTGYGTDDIARFVPVAPFPASCISSINHPLFAGVNLDTQFEQEPGKKDMTAMASYLDGFNNIR